MNHKHGDDQANLDDQLEAWGNAGAPAPTATFSQRLEADLRSSMYFGNGDAAPHRRAWFARPAFAFGALVLLIGGAVWLGQSEDQTVTTVAVDEASSTEIRFADGSTEPAAEGAALPDGTRVVVGPDGSAVVDGVVIASGVEAEIIDGIVEILGPSTPTPEPAAPTALPTETQVQTPTPETPTASDEPTPSQSTPRPTGESTTQPEPTVRPTPSAEATPEPAPTATTAPTAQPTAAPTAEPAGPFSVELALSTQGDALVLSWELNNAPPSLRGYEVIALTDDGVRTVAVIRDPETTTLTIRGRRANGYQVIARSETEPLAESNIVE